MEKIYNEYCLKPANKETNKYWTELAHKRDKMQRTLPKTEYKAWIRGVHDALRITCLPDDEKNKLIALVLATDKITKEELALILVFDRKPDGKTYDICFDEDTPYFVTED